MAVYAPNHLRFVAVGQDDALAEPLLAELAVEYASRYGNTVDAVGAWLREHPAEEFAPPHGGMFVGAPVTGGAFCRFDAETAELKRIWTHSGHRRRGNRQPEAEALYLATGYRRLAEPLPSVGEVYPLAFAKDLT